MAGQNTIQSVGDFSAVFTHPNVLAGAQIGLIGFKVEGQIVDGSQVLDNSKIVPLIGGNTITITNTVRSGTLTWTCVPTSGDAAKGDIVAISQMLQQLGDNVGGILRFSYGMNGSQRSVTFIGVTVKRCKPLSLQGNDVPDYAVEWNYADFGTN